jgi:dihydrofolate reductase
MRKLVVAEYLSLDGVMQDPGGSGEFEKGGWSGPYFSDDLAKFQYDCLVASDALLLGRRTYEGFAAAWPKMTDEGDFAVRMNSYPKYVVSSTLKDPEWNNSSVVDGSDVGEEVRKLKQLPGQDILVYGSGQLVRSLLAEGLVDELRLMVHPVVVGAGKRLFEEGTTAALKPASAELLGSVVALIFQPAGTDPAS